MTGTDGALGPGMALLVDHFGQMAAEFAHAIADPHVWAAIVAAILVGSLCLAIGAWVSRRVGLLDSGAPAGETIGVGLGSGLLMLTSVWAAVASGGRSAFTPVALAFFCVI